MLNQEKFLGLYREISKVGGTIRKAQMEDLMPYLKDIEAIDAAILNLHDYLNQILVQTQGGPEVPPVEGPVEEPMPEEAEIPTEEDFTEPPVDEQMPEEEMPEEEPIPAKASSVSFRNAVQAKLPKIKHILANLKLNQEWIVSSGVARIVSAMDHGALFEIYKASNSDTYKVVRKAVDKNGISEDKWKTMMSKKPAEEIENLINSYISRVGEMDPKSPSIGFITKRIKDAQAILQDKKKEKQADILKQDQSDQQMKAQGYKFKMVPKKDGAPPVYTKDMNEANKKMRENAGEKYDVLDLS
jgi:hypothetical protein